MYILARYFLVYSSKAAVSFLSLHTLRILPLAKCSNLPMRYTVRRQSILAEHRLYIMVLVYKSLHRLAPPYLSDDCQLVTDVGRRHIS